MGKLTLLLVLAAALGGSTLLFSTRSLSHETARERGEVQADLLARDAAANGHSLVLNEMIADDGFEAAAPYTSHNVQDGWFSVDEYTVATDAAGTQTVTYTVTGHAGGAEHSVRSTYEYDPMDYPGPLWLDVPYVTATVEPGTVIDGGADALGVHYDRRRHSELNLNSLLPRSTMERDLRTAFAGATGLGGAFSPHSNMQSAGLLDDLNVSDASDLYFAAVSAKRTGDVTLPGATTISTNQNYGSTPMIVHVTGPLTIAPSKRLEGRGVLIVEGAISLGSNGSRLTWDGLVIIHSEEDYLHLDWNTGRVDITGGLVVDQQAVPPGGHMDVTTTRDLDGRWSNARGDRSGSPWASIGAGNWPWFQHKHRYDIDLGTSTVMFRADTPHPNEEYTQFRDALSSLGTRQVFLEFDRERYHGYSTYTLDIAGQPEVYGGAVKNGFGTYAQSGDVQRSQSFRANDLRSFQVDVRSLRMLRQRFDTASGCDSWPFCVAEQWGRGGALTVRLREYNPARRHPKLYEAVIYWHMRSDEVAEHMADEAALRTAIQDGALFGTRLDFGDHVDLTFDLDEIKTMASRLGFDGDEVLSRGTWTTHTTVDEHRAAGTTAPSGPRS
ncbi:MAG: hypothetical protein HKN04_14955, partial [Rhodothermaceae bacterium]|nr:hypothetical protein [Rhodothermaceae bacterium]